MIEPHHIALSARLGGISLARHADMVKGFFHTGEAYYAKSALRDGIADSITIGFYDVQDGGTTGEFSIDFGQFTHTSPKHSRWAKLNVFTDGMNALVNMPELLVGLAQFDKEEQDDRTPTPQQVIRLLLDLGYMDRTQRSAR